MGRTRKLTFAPLLFPTQSLLPSSPPIPQSPRILPMPPLATAAPGPRFLRKTNSTEQQASAKEAAAVMQAEFISEELTYQQKFDQMKTKFDGKGSHSQART